MVRQQKVGAGALDCGENLQRNSALVHPTVRCRSFHHRVLTADVVRAERYVKALARAGEHVEVRERRFHHDDVRALSDVGFDLAHGLTRVTRVHLIASTVSKLRSGAGGLAKWSVEAGGI